MIAEIIRELIAAGLQGESLVAAVERIEQAQPKVVDTTAENRRAKDRERKRRARGSPLASAESAESTDVCGSPQTGSFLLTSSSESVTKQQESKKERKSQRARKSLLPDDWQPNQHHQAKAAKNGHDLNDKADALRSWAKSKAVMRADWDATFDGFLRPKEATNGKYRKSPSQRAYGFANQIRQLELTEGVGRPPDVLGGGNHRR
jgi:hypothetical protein